MDKNVDIQYSRWGFSTIRIISIRRSEAMRCLLSWLYYGGSLRLVFTRWRASVGLHQWLQRKAYFW